MPDFPKITTAIPKKRFQVGEYNVTVLGEVESPDFPAYFFIMAFVQDGKKDPVLYVCADKTPPNKRHEGLARLRVVNSAMSEIMDINDRWKDLQQFSDEALQIGMQILGIQSETIAPLM